MRYVGAGLFGFGSLATYGLVVELTKVRSTAIMCAVIVLALFGSVIAAIYDNKK